MISELLPASHGAGPLLQRDYWAVLDGCDLKPAEVMAHVKEHFCELPPATLVEFVAEHGLCKDAELDIRIMPAQQCKVRVVHENDQSVTLGTLQGHPEAGRITFGAYRNGEGDVIFHIRSRARSSSRTKFLGFVAVGEAMQTNTWTDFINHTAVLVGSTIRDVIHAETRQVDEMPDDDGVVESPTFRATGG
ncbi:MAG: DUF1990 domain-containing protein [Acidobacteriota bacterium]|nr:DUF1990 domain-containing protein [Acidobacteriota bacterium]